MKRKKEEEEEEGATVHQGEIIIPSLWDESKL